MSSSPAERTWRRFMRISTRGLMILTLLIGACLGWIIRDARIQRDSVAAIKRAGGMVHYDWAWHNGVINIYGKPPAPRWLVDRLGVDYFGHVTSVSIWNLKSPDQGLAQVANLTRLEALMIQGGLRLSDSGLVGMNRLTNLRVLDLANTTVSDSGLAHVKTVTTLRSLDLRMTSVTAAGVNDLQAALPKAKIIR